MAPAAPTRLTPPRQRTRRWSAAPCAVALLGAAAAAQPNPNDLPVVDEAIAIQDRRGATIPLELEFIDEGGRTVRLGDYLRGERPVILNLGYYGCPRLCGTVMQGMVEGLRGVRLELGADYEIVSVTIDPSEAPPLAREKKASFASSWGNPAVWDHWHFLSGDGDRARSLASTVGFNYQWNQFGKQWDHGAGIFLLSPTGQLVQTLYGSAFSPRDLRLALVEASQGKIGSAFDRILLSCYGYDPRSGGYTLLVWTVVRVAGVATVLGLAVMIIMLLRRERRRVAAAAT